MDDPSWAERQHVTKAGGCDQVREIKIVDIAWGHVPHFLVENPNAQVCGPVELVGDGGGVTWFAAGGRWGLRFIVVPSLQGDRLWLPPGYVAGCSQ